MGGSIGAMAAEGVDGSGSGYAFAAVRDAARDEILFACAYGNFLAVDDQRVTALHDQHVFVVVVDVLRG